MTSTLRVEFDRAEWDRKVKGLRDLAQKGLINTLTGPRAEFVRKAQVYLAAQMDRAMQKNGGIPEGGTARVRGRDWRGWAKKQRHTKWGDPPPESTRYYFRKFRRGLRWIGPRSQADYAAQKKIFAGTLRGEHRKSWERQSLADRPWEKVYRRRASGAFYSDSSKLMLDTGRMRMGLIVMRTALNGNAIELRPGSMVDYFYRQNALRPIWVLDEPTDKPQLVKYAQQALDQVTRELLK